MLLPISSTAREDNVRDVKHKLLIEFIYTLMEKGGNMLQG